ncbi:uncharacterized protein LOC132789951 [Drosophila nasuta]|uniref:uncharacterized protein LOC132789951 n=1 Tax=Drosophila nasuta TaxID=42062 RepID=UPI00295EBAA4|nr:uncharacterized protein LOC132789951 [Drosophila nasuta]
MASNPEPKLNPRRQWTSRECESILNFMRHHPFEQPTTVAYYKMMTQEVNPELDYILVRCKVANMIKGYKRAKLQKLKNFPYYKQFQEIFKKPKPVVERLKLSPSQLDAMTLEDTDDNDEDRKLFQFPQTAETSAQIHSEHIIDPESIVENPQCSEMLEQTLNQEFAHSDINQVPLQSNTINDPLDLNALLNTKNPQRRKFLLDQEVKIMELNLREKELRLRFFEAKTHGQLVRLKIESKERIAMKKLALKYGRE